MFTSITTNSESREDFYLGIYFRSILGFSKWVVFIKHLTLGLRDLCGKESRCDGRLQGNVSSKYSRLMVITIYELIETMIALLGTALFQARQGPSLEKRMWTWAKLTLPKNYLQLIASNKGRLSFLP